jgi:hypothetical protein
MDKEKVKEEIAQSSIDLGFGVVGKAIDFATGNTGIATELLSNTTGIVEGVSLLKKKITQKKSEKKEKKEHNGE